MFLPFEIVAIIYYLSDIDTRLIFNKLCPTNSFLSRKLYVNKNLYLLLSNLYRIRINKYNHIKSLQSNLSSHFLLQNL